MDLIVRGANLPDGRTDIDIGVESGRIVNTAPLDAEKEHRDLARIAFHHTRRDWGRVRQMVDVINTF